MNIYTPSSSDQFALGLQNYPMPKVQEDSWCGWGGDTTSDTFWINNGSEEMLLKAHEEVPDGWRKGRKSSLPFKNSEKQKELSLRVNKEDKSKILKIAWASGKFSNRDTTNIGKNQNWTEERKKHQSMMALKREKICCPHCNKYYQPGMAKRWHFDNCKMRK